MNLAKQMKEKAEKTLSERAEENCLEIYPIVLKAIDKKASEGFFGIRIEPKSNFRDILTNQYLRDKVIEKLKEDGFTVKFYNETCCYLSITW